MPLVKYQDINQRDKSEGCSVTIMVSGLELLQNDRKESLVSLIDHRLETARDILKRKLLDPTENPTLKG